MIEEGIRTTDQERERSGVRLALVFLEMSVRVSQDDGRVDSQDMEQGDPRDSGLSLIHI